MLKRARNHCVFHKGFLVPSSDNSNEYIKLGRQEFVNILNQNGWTGPGVGKLGPDDFRTSFKFTPEHLNNSGHKAQNVRKAAQTFSHTNAKAIMLMGRTGPYTPSHAKSLHDAVKIFNDW